MKRKKRLSKVIIILIFLIGLSLLLYPTVSDYWNSFHQSRAVFSYEETVAKLDEEECDEVWSEASEYNDELMGKKNPFVLSEAEHQAYESVLNVSENGIMGYIEIPAIDCTLPIYHGVEESVLQIGAGHLPGSSLPIGGDSTHCVIVGHCGLPSAKLFTDLHDLSEGDVFLLHVLEETLIYEVDQILTVKPQDVEALTIQEGEDYCTLVTCTPYGSNTHRLLVRGNRIENPEDSTVEASAKVEQVGASVDGQQKGVSERGHQLGIVEGMIIIAVVVGIVIVMVVRTNRKMG